MFSYAISNVQDIMILNMIISSQSLCFLFLCKMDCRDMVELGEGKDLPYVSGQNNFLIDALLPLLILRYLGIACILKPLLKIHFA